MTHAAATAGQIEKLRRTLAKDRPAISPKLACEGKEAAVLVPLFEREGGLHALFIRRSDSVASHRGQVAFPGGRAEPRDGNLLVAALRETREEVGIEPRMVDVLGCFPALNTLTSGIVVTPVVGIVPDPHLISIRPDPHEVAEAFSVPIAALDDPKYRSNYTWRSGGGSADYPAILYGEQIIWGLTFRITLNLLQILNSEVVCR